MSGQIKPCNRVIQKSSILGYYEGPSWGEGVFTREAGAKKKDLRKMMFKDT